MCAKFLHAWWLVRNDLERAQGLAPRGRCCHHRKDLCPHKSYAAVEHEKMRALPMSSSSGSTTTTTGGKPETIVRLPDVLLDPES